MPVPFPLAGLPVSLSALFPQAHTALPVPHRYSQHVWFSVLVHSCCHLFDRTHTQSSHLLSCFSPQPGLQSSSEPSYQSNLLSLTTPDILYPVASNSSWPLPGQTSYPCSSTTQGETAGSGTQRKGCLI